MSRASATPVLARRLGRVMTALHAGRRDGHDLATLATIACLSPWHFHRLYRRVTGETPAATQTRLRLHRAAMALARSNRPLFEIARAAGFSSTAAFTRAFRAGHGLPPARFRQSCQTSPIMPDIAIQTRDPLRLIVTEHLGPPWLVGAAFDRLVAWAGAAGLIDEDRLGVTVRMTRPDVPMDQQRTLAGLALEALAPADPAFFAYDLPGGRHAVAVHRGAYATLGATWTALYQWIAEQGLTPANRPAFEVNRNNPRHTAPADLLTDVCVPLP